MVSTMNSAGWPTLFIRRRTSATRLATPVDVSLCTIATALIARPRSPASLDRRPRQRAEDAIRHVRRPRDLEKMAAGQLFRRQGNAHRGAIGCGGGSKADGHRGSDERHRRAAEETHRPVAEMFEEERANPAADDRRDTFP